MNRDIRLLVSFRNHRKRKRFRMILGDPGATDYLIDLWLTAAEDRPEGLLTDWDEIDIALSCGWEGEPKQLVDALVKSKWLDVQDDGTYALHDWKEHQGWASNANARSKAAKKAAKARWAERLAEKSANKKTCEGNAIAYEPHKTHDADAEQSIGLGVDSARSDVEGACDKSKMSVPKNSTTLKVDAGNGPGRMKKHNDNQGVNADSCGAHCGSNTGVRPPSPSPSPSPTCFS